MSDPQDGGPVVSDNHRIIFQVLHIAELVLILLIIKALQGF